MEIKVPLPPPQVKGLAVVRRKDGSISFAPGMSEEAKQKILDQLKEQEHHGRNA